MSGQFVPPSGSTPARGSQSRGSESPFGSVELAPDKLEIVWLLRQCRRIPLTSWGSHEISPVDVDGARIRRPGRVVDRMDDVVTQQNHSAIGKLLTSRRDDGVAVSAVKGVVFTAAVNADSGPHTVIVREEGHQRGPDDVEDCEILRPVEDVQPGRGFGPTFGQRSRR